MGIDKRTKIEEISVAIIFIIMLIMAICFSLDKGNAAAQHPQVNFENVD